MSEIEQKKQILASFLKICQESKIDGNILPKLAKDCEIDEAKIELIFENGIVGIIEFFITDVLRDLEGLVDSDNDFHSKKVRQKIHFCLFNFFNIQKKNRKAVRSIKDFYFDLGNLACKNNGLTPVSFAVKSSYLIADKMWIILKDKSTDHNYYSKRMVLSKITAKAFFTFIDDESNDLQKTSDLISVEIEKVMSFEKFKKNVMEICGASKEEICAMVFNEDGKVKSIGDIVKKLPFIRLFN